MEFETWKAEYEPRVYVDSGAECFEHEECDCEFLYTYDITELDDKDDEDDEDSLILAVKENRVWTWDNKGIRSGITNTSSDLLVTKKAWTNEMEIS